MTDTSLGLELFMGPDKKEFFFAARVLMDDFYFTYTIPCSPVFSSLFL